MKIPFRYEEVKINYTIPEKDHIYTPDLLLENGVYIEIKGVFDADDRKKTVHVLESNPELDLRLLFMRDNPITKTSKTRYTDWCNKRGILCAVSPTGIVPEDWLHPNQPIRNYNICQPKPQKQLSICKKMSNITRPSPSSRTKAKNK